MSARGVKLSIAKETARLPGEAEVGLPVMLTLKQAAGILNVSPTTLYRFTYERKIPFYKLGGLKRFRKSDLEAWLAACFEPPIAA